MNWDDLTPEERLNVCGVPYPKVTVCKRDDYEIQYEQVGEATFVHVNVLNWTTDTKDQFKRDCDTLQSLLNRPVFVLCDNRDIKLRKFCAQFGFEHAMDIVTTEGAPSAILIRTGP